MTPDDHDEYCHSEYPKFVINYTFDVCIDGDGGQRLPPILLFRRTFTDVREAVRVARRMQRLGGGILQGIGVLHDHLDCQGLLCLNKLDESGDKWEEEFLCYYTKPGNTNRYFLDGDCVKGH